MQECLLGQNIKNHYTDAKNQVDPDGDNSYTGSITSASLIHRPPYADVGPYIKADKEVDSYL